MNIEFFDKVLILHKLTVVDDCRIICAVAETTSDIMAKFKPSRQNIDTFIANQKEAGALSPECYIIDQVDTTEGWDLIGIQSSDAITRINLQIHELHKVFEEIRSEQTPHNQAIKTHRYVTMDALRVGGTIEAVRRKNKKR